MKIPLKFMLYIFLLACEAFCPTVRSFFGLSANECFPAFESDGVDIHRDVLKKLPPQPATPCITSTESVSADEVHVRVIFSYPDQDADKVLSNRLAQYEIRQLPDPWHTKYRFCLIKDEVVEGLFGSSFTIPLLLTSFLIIYKSRRHKQYFDNGPMFIMPRKGDILSVDLRFGATRSVHSVKFTQYMNSGAFNQLMELIEETTQAADPQEYIKENVARFQSLPIDKTPNPKILDEVPPHVIRNRMSIAPKHPTSFKMPKEGLRPNRRKPIGTKPRKFSMRNI